MFPFTFSPRFTASLLIFSSVSPFHTLLSHSLFISAVFISFFSFSLFYPFLFSSSRFLTIPLSSLFLSPPSIFISYLCHSFKLVFRVSRLSKCFTWNIVFHVFSSRARHKESISILSFCKTHSFCTLLIFRIIVFFILFCHFSWFLYFPLFLRVSRGFLSPFFLFY